MAHENGFKRLSEKKEWGRHQPAECLRMSQVGTSLVGVFASLFFQTGNPDVYVDKLWRLYQLALTA